MNMFRYLAAATVVASLTACSTALSTAHSGFLSDYTALAGAPDTAAASLASADRIDPARVTVDAVAWHAALAELMARFSKLAAAEIAVRKAAADFVPLLQPASIAGNKTAQR